MQEESKTAQKYPHFMNTEASPLQAFKEASTTGASQGGIYFSEDLAQEVWFLELRRLCHKRNLAIFQSDEANPEES